MDMNHEANRVASFVALSLVSSRFFHCNSALHSSIFEAKSDACGSAAFLLAPLQGRVDSVGMKVLRCAMNSVWHGGGGTAPQIKCDDWMIASIYGACLANVSCNRRILT